MRLQCQNVGEGGARRVKVERFETGMMMNNTYVAWCAETRRAAAVDPVGSCRQALGFIRDNALTLDFIIYTHAHPDHVSGAASLKKATGARVAAHALARKLMRGPLMLLCSGLGLAFKPVPPDMPLEDGSELRIGNSVLRVLHTPGHTPDGICLAGPGLVFTGDTLISESVGRTDLPGGSGSLLMRSIRDKLLPLPGDTVVYPGHGPATTLAHERAHNPFLVNFK